MARTRFGAATPTTALTPTPWPKTVLELLPHPLQPAAAERTLKVSVTAARDGGVTLHYRLCGGLDGLCVPSPQTPSAADGLWMHTCFEAFIAVPGEPAYREFNFSPSGEWAIYAFADYRDRDPSWTTPLAPTIDFAQSELEFSLRVHLPHAALPPHASKGLLEIGLSAVMEECDGSLSYWALRHPAARPDFHHRDGYALGLAAADPPHSQPGINHDADG
jgi:hypothetical protein